jgi:hypothetical protein
MKVPQNLMLVTHQVNITALTGAHPSPGETIVARPPSADRKALAVAISILISCRLGTRASAACC